MKSSSAAYNLPKGWEWVLDIVDAAHVPKLGLPVKWDETKVKHQRIAFDPATRRSVNLDTNKETISKESPIGFIKSTKGTNPMPGSNDPASARVTRYMEPHLHQAIVQDVSGSLLIPCMAHGDYVKVESLEADHAQSKASILSRQRALIEKLNADPDFANFLMQKPGMNKFFVKLKENKKNVYYGTLFFYELYFNDIDNVWLICDACNSNKSDQEALQWFGEQWLYGQDFLDYLTKCQYQKTPGRILDKTKDKDGLAKVAIGWFWKTHANYISIAKQLQEDVVIPIKILNVKVDRVVGQGSQIRAERLEASLRGKMGLLSTMAKAKIEMPRGSDESSHSSSNDELKLPITPFVSEKTGERVDITPVTYSKSIKSATQKTSEVMLEFLDEEITTRMKEKKGAIKQKKKGTK